MSGVRIDGHAVVRSLSAFLGDARDFLLDNPLLPVALVVLAIVVFRITSPRVR